MKSLHQMVRDYLTLRRSLGYKLESDGRQLLDFTSFLKRAGSSFITTKLAVAWATQPMGISTGTAAKRLGVVRTFAEFACAHDPRTQIPPSQCLPYQKARPMPYLYSTKEIRALIEAAQALPTSAFRRSTYSTLIGLLAVTGMRAGEAMGLDCQDFDPKDGLLTIRAGKFGKAREVPLHTTTQAALSEYERKRDRVHPCPRSPAFFLSAQGTRLLRQNVTETFHQVLRQAGLEDRKPRRPRMHDLRHTFAVHTLCDWHRAGMDVEAQLPLLSTYLGHVSPSSTYWYLTAVPELAGAAAHRLERAMGDLP